MKGNNVKFYHPELEREINLFDKDELQVDFPATGLTERETDVVNGAKKANPFVFRLVMIMLSVLQERRYKYSGAYHPLINFYDIARRNNAKTKSDKFTAIDSALTLESVKESRNAVSGGKDFNDESMFDTFVDNQNYTLIKKALELFDTPLEHLFEADGDFRRWFDF